MASKKKTLTEAPAEKKTEKQEQEVTSTEETEKTKEAEREAPQTEETEAPAPAVKENTFPYEATVAVALAVLRKSIEPATADMLKPVATLKQGTKITITDIHGNNARLANGLWIALEYITR